VAECYATGFGTTGTNYTLSAGGPIIKNKTFFFGLWDGLINNRRTVQNVTILTPCARNGVFRYFDNWNNGNLTQTTAFGSTPTIRVVDDDWHPMENPRHASEQSRRAGT